LRQSANDFDPELAQGGAAGVDQIRSEPDERYENTIRRGVDAME
jgi:hypothetical protein